MSKNIKFLRVSSESVLSEFGNMTYGHELMPDHPLFIQVVEREGYHEPGEVSPKPFEAVYEEGTAKTAKAEKAEAEAAKKAEAEKAEAEKAEAEKAEAEAADEDDETEDTDGDDDSTQSSRRRKRR